jgi:hypothetical protein
MVSSILGCVYFKKLSRHLKALIPFEKLGAIWSIVCLSCEELKRLHVVYKKTMKLLVLTHQKEMLVLS